MAMAITPEAVEFGIPHTLAEIRAAIAQIDGQEYPSKYDNGCRRYIGECLDSLDRDRHRQIELGWDAPPPLEAGLRLDVLPSSATLADLHRWRRWVEFEGMTRPQNA